MLSLFIFSSQLSQNRKQRIVGYQRLRRIHLCCLKEFIRWRYFKIGIEAKIGFGSALMPSHLGVHPPNTSIHFRMQPLSHLTADTELGQHIFLTIYLNCVWPKCQQLSRTSFKISLASEKKKKT